MQPTAIAVLEQEVLKNRNRGAETGALQLRHLERLPLDVNYPKTVARISKLLETQEIKDGERCGKTDVLLDLTGSGGAIVELFERDEIDPICVRIAGAGTLQERDQNGQWRIPKVDLVGALRVLYEAERLKMGGSASEQSQEVVPQEVEQAIRSVTDTVVGEISRSLDFFSATAAESRISKVYLCGGGANVAGFVNSFNERTGFEVEVLNPLARMLPSKGFDPEYLDEIKATLGVGIGLATRRVEG
jgi:hypothetical protein